MYKAKTLLFLYAETPVHPGAGSGTGVIDLPVQREAFSDLPIFQASGVKGALREHFEAQVPSGGSVKAAGTPLPASPIIDAFGPDTAGASDHAGALSVGDAKLLLFPVRSLHGVFAYVTCPMALKRFQRDLTMIGATVPSWPTTVPDPQGDTISVIPLPRIAVSNGATTPTFKAVFQDYAFTATPETSTQTIAEFIRDFCFPTASEYAAWKTDFPGRFAIVPDGVFRDFTRTATEVISRNRIDDNTKTVAEGALWIEEHLPSETVLYCPVLAADPLTNTGKRTKALQDAQAVLGFLKAGCTVNGQTFCGVEAKRLRLGGDQTVGRGIMMAHFFA